MKWKPQQWGFFNGKENMTKEEYESQKKEYTFSGMVKLTVRLDLPEPVTVKAINLASAKQEMESILNVNYDDWYYDGDYELDDLDCDKDE